MDKLCTGRPQTRPIGASYWWAAGTHLRAQPRPDSLSKGVRSNWAMVDDPVFEGFLPKVLGLKTWGNEKNSERTNEYVARQHFLFPYYSRERILMSAVGEGFQRPVRFGVGARRRAAMLSFYLPRFWIDQKNEESNGTLKKRNKNQIAMIKQILNLNI